MTDWDAICIWNGNLTKWPLNKVIVQQNGWLTKQSVFEMTILQNDHYTMDWLKIPDWQSNQYLKWQSYKMTSKQNDWLTNDWLTKQLVLILQNDPYTMDWLKMPCWQNNQYLKW